MNVASTRSAPPGGPAGDIHRPPRRLRILFLTSAHNGLRRLMWVA
jgi:hypothetical protein